MDLFNRATMVWGEGELFKARLHVYKWSPINSTVYICRGPSFCVQFVGFRLLRCELTWAGCLDPNATNYDAQAIIDSGTCTYVDDAEKPMLSGDLRSYLTETLTKVRMGVSRLHSGS
jgi:hypothetical protein